MRAYDVVDNADEGVLSNATEGELAAGQLFVENAGGDPRQATIAALLDYFSGRTLLTGSAAPDNANAVANVSQAYFRTSSPPKIYLSDATASTWTLLETDTAVDYAEVGTQTALDALNTENQVIIVRVTAAFGSYAVNDRLIYSTASSGWKVLIPASDIASTVPTFLALANFPATNPVDGTVLLFNTGQTTFTAGKTVRNEADDTDVTSASKGTIFKYFATGTKWVRQYIPPVGTGGSTVYAARAERIYFNGHSNVGTTPVNVVIRTATPIDVRFGDGDPNIIATVEGNTGTFRFLKRGIYEIHLDGFLDALGSGNSRRLLPRVRMFNNSNIIAEVDDHYHRTDGSSSSNLRMSGDGIVYIPTDNYDVTLQLANEIHSGGVNFDIDAGWSLTFTPFGVRGEQGPAGAAGTRLSYVTSRPPDSQGNNGDAALNVDTGEFYFRSGGTWTSEADFVTESELSTAIKEPFAGFEVLGTWRKNATSASSAGNYHTTASQVSINDTASDSTDKSDDLDDLEVGYGLVVGDKTFVITAITVQTGHRELAGYWAGNVADSETANTVVTIQVIQHDMRMGRYARVIDLIGDVGISVSYVTAQPANDSGNNGDVAINENDGKVYFKSGGTWSEEIDFATQAELDAARASSSSTPTLTEIARTGTLPTAAQTTAFEVEWTLASGPIGIGRRGTNNSILTLPSVRPESGASHILVRAYKAGVVFGEAVFGIGAFNSDSDGDPQVFNSRPLNFNPGEVIWVDYFHDDTNGDSIRLIGDGKTLPASATVRVYYMEFGGSGSQFLSGDTTSYLLWRAGVNLSDQVSSGTTEYTLFLNRRFEDYKWIVALFGANNPTIQHAFTAAIPYEIFDAFPTNGRWVGTTEVSHINIVKINETTFSFPEGGGRLHAVFGVN